MKNNASRVGVTVFFAAVIIVSVVMMARNRDSELTDTLNTMPEEYRTDTAVPEAETAATQFRGHDFDFEVPDDTSVGQADDYEREHDSDDHAEVTAVPEDDSDETAPPVTTVSRTIITSRQRKEYDSNSVYIDMKNIIQLPELPVGCEITALTILLNFYGFDAEKTDMAKNYLPTSWGRPETIDGKFCKDSFYDYFIGDPFTKGYGCFSPAIEAAANSYISSHGGGYTVKNISGCHPDTLYEYLIAGTPVLCWATDGMIEPEYYETWFDRDTGEQLDWYLNEHCFVLAGFNISNSTVTLNDPMKGIIDYNIDKFEIRFRQMHSQAIVIIPEGGQEPVTEAVTEAVTSVPETEFTETEAPTETVSAEEPTDTAPESNVWETTPSEEQADTDFYTGDFFE